jgi:hypothetical protein
MSSGVVLLVMKLAPGYSILAEGPVGRNLPRVVQVCRGRCGAGREVISRVAAADRTPACFMSPADSMAKSG